MAQVIVIATRRRALLTTVLVAAALRPAVTSVGPLIQDIGTDLQVSEVGLGILGAIPLVGFGVCSLLAAPLLRRRGLEGALVAAMLLMATGIILRSVGGVGGLWTGTLLAAGAIGVGNVLLPVLVKRDFARAAVATAVATTSLTVFAAVASGVAVPLARLLGGWQQSLAVWSLVPLLCVAVLLGRSARGSGAPAAETEATPGAPPQDGLARMRSLLTSRTAWSTTLFFGLQSMTFYVVVTWLPSIEASHGTSAGTAGWHLLIYQLLGSAAGFAIGFLIEGRWELRTAAVAVTAPVGVAALGLAAAPGLIAVWLVLLAVGAGGALTVALTYVVVGAESGDQITALSTMAQSVGYLIAALGPLGAGALAHHFDWDTVLHAVAAVAAVQLILALRIRRKAVP